MRSHSTTCSIPDCAARRRARGWCNKHYSRWLTHGDPLVTLRPEMEQLEAERFWPKVEKTGACWLWTGALAGGSGQFWAGGKLVQAHRWAYEQANGPIPEGLTLDHLCRNRACVEVTHLEPVTNRVNILRGIGATALNARKARCKRGHRFTPENIYTRENGGRNCRQCKRARDRSRARRIK